MNGHLRNVCIPNSLLIHLQDQLRHYFCSQTDFMYFDLTVSTAIQSDEDGDSHFNQRKSHIYCCYFIQCQVVIAVPFILIFFILKNILFNHPHLSLDWNEPDWKQVAISSLHSILIQIYKYLCAFYKCTLSPLRTLAPTPWISWNGSRAKTWWCGTGRDGSTGLNDKITRATTWHGIISMFLNCFRIITKFTKIHDDIKRASSPSLLYLLLLLIFIPT